MFQSASLPHRGVGAIGLAELLVMFAAAITLWGVYRLRR